MVNAQTGALEGVPVENVAEGYTARRYGFETPNTRVPVRLADDRFGTVPASEAYKAFAEGATPISLRSFAGSKLREARDEMFREWVAELAERTQAHFDYLLPRVEALEVAMGQRSEDPTAGRVYANYARAADAEPTGERRLMLDFAAAALIDPRLTVAQQARAERLIRELDPDDVLWLNVIARAVGGFFETRNVTRPGRVRWFVWSKAGADILAASGCVRVTHYTGGVPTPDGHQTSGWDEVEVTREGKLVLHVLRLYVRAREPPMEIPGQERRDGDRSEETAWTIIDAISGRTAAVRLSVQRQPVYDYAKVHYQTGAPPPHDAKAVLRFEAVPVINVDPGFLETGLSVATCSSHEVSTRVTKAAKLGAPQR